MCEKSVDKTDSSSNFWKITPISDEMTSVPTSPTQCTPCEKPTIEIKHLGVEKVDPNCYYQRYGSSLKQHSQLPDIVQKVKQVERVTLAAERESKYFMNLEGDVHALCMIDLEKEGLGEYKKYLNERNILNCPCIIEQKKEGVIKTKIKPEIVKLENQELESIDLYKERLNEYKLAVKPAVCNNSESAKEENSDKKIINETPAASNTPPVANTPAISNTANQPNQIIATNLVNNSNNATSANQINSTNSTNPVNPGLNAILSGVNMPIRPNTAAQNNPPIEQGKTNAKPLLQHPSNYQYSPIQNLYYLLQLNLLKNSLLNHYLQNVTVAKYVSNNPNRASATNFIMNRNFF